MMGGVGDDLELRQFKLCFFWCLSVFGCVKRRNNERFFFFGPEKQGIFFFGTCSVLFFFFFFLSIWCELLFLRM